MDKCIAVVGAGAGEIPAAAADVVVDNEIAAVVVGTVAVAVVDVFELL